MYMHRSYSQPLLKNSIFNTGVTVFQLIILEMFQQLHWSLTVVNSIDWTQFKKEHIWSQGTDGHSDSF